MADRYTITFHDPYNIGDSAKVYYQLPSDFWGGGSYDGYAFDSPYNDVGYALTPESGVNTSDFIQGNDDSSYVDTFYGGLGVDTLEGHGDNDTLFGGSGDDTVYGGDDDDVIYGDYADLPDIENDTTWATPSEDTSIVGDDTLHGGNGTDTFHGGAGNDLIYGENGSDTVYVGSGNDQIDAGPRGSGWTDVVYGGDGIDSFLLNYDTTSGGNGTDFWETYSSNYASDSALTIVSEIVGAGTNAAVKAAFTSMGSSILLSGLGAAAGEAAELGIEYLLGMNKSSKPSESEDVLVITDFDPRADTIFIPLDSGVTLTESASFFTSAAVSSVSGWGIQFQDGVDGTTYAEVFLDSGYLEALGITSSASAFAIDAILSILATSLTIGSSGVQNADEVYALSDEDAIDFAAQSGTSVTVFGAFGPLSVVDPSGSSEIVVGGTNMGDIITANHELFLPDEFVDDAAAVTSTESFLRGFEGDDLLYGGVGADVLYGDDGDDQLYAFLTTETSDGPEAELLYGGNGNDFFSVGTGAATIDGGNGDDVLSFAYGTSEGVTASLLTGQGYDGGGSAAKPNYAFTDIDTLIGTGYDDTLSTGNGGGQLVYGGSGNDALTGGSGSDTLQGDNGTDELYGGDGDDILHFGGADRTVDGGNGTDTADFSDDTSGLTIDLSTGKIGSSGTIANIEILIGSAYADTLTGTGEGDTLIGGGGGDTYIGGASGSDVVDYSSFASGGVGINLVTDVGTGNAAGDSWTGVESIVGTGHGDTIIGDEGNNAFDAGGSADTLDGGDGNDTLSGGNGNDILSGGNDDDVLYGGDGHDRFYGGDGDDTLNVGASEVDFNDTFWGGNGTDVISQVDFERNFYTLSYDSALDLALLLSTSYTYLYFDPTSIEYVQFPNGHYAVGFDGVAAVTLTQVTDGVSVIELDEGDAHEGAFVHKALASFGIGDGSTLTSIAAEEGYRGAVQAEVENGRLSWSFIVEDSDLDDLAAGEGRSQTYTMNYLDAAGQARQHSLTVTLEGAADFAGRTVRGGPGDDDLAGGPGDDRMYAGAGDDLVRASSGADIVLGQDGNDVLRGGSGDDTAYGGNGADTVCGEAGNDRLGGGDGDDRLSGGNGNDWLTDESGDDRLNGGSGSDTIAAGDGNDRLWGGDGFDTLYGRDGRDFIWGGDGGDRLSGGNGDDTLWGGAGDDRLSGGSGDDRLVFAPGGGIDTVVAFQQGHDVLDLRAFSGLTFADLEIRTYRGGSTVIVDGGEIRLAVTTLTAADFLF